MAGRASRVKVSNHKKFVNTLNDVFSNFLPAAGGTKFASKWEKQKTDLKEAFDKIRLRSILVFNTAQVEAAAAQAAQAAQYPLPLIVHPIWVGLHHNQ